LLETASLPSWHGSFGNISTTDYDRACRIDDYVGAIEVGSGIGIVLGEEPFSTTWWWSEELRNGFIVRWVYAEDETRVRAALKSVPSDNWQATDVRLEILNGELILFDSACSGTSSDSFLTIEMSPGSYAVETLHYRPNDDLFLILHRFVAQAQR